MQNRRKKGKNGTYPARKITAWETATRECRGWRESGEAFGEAEKNFEERKAVNSERMWEGWTVRERESAEEWVIEKFPYDKIAPRHKRI